MTVLITGATGFTGGHMARTLASRRYQVRALVRSLDRGRDLTLSGIDIVEGDIRDRASLERALDGVDVIYNIAAIYREAGLPQAEYDAVNARAVATIVEAAAVTGVKRVLHCSTVGVHGDIEHPPANEDAPFRPGDVYQRSKLRGERLGREAAERTGVELTIVRPTGIYGPGDRRLLKIFRGVARRRWVTLGSGRIYYHVTYVDDVVEGFRVAAESPQAAGRTYIIGGCEVPTLNELVARIAREVGVRPPQLHLPVWPVWLAGALCEIACAPFGAEPPLYRRRVEFFTKSRAFDISRARTEIGFEPKVDLTEGIRRTLEWYRAFGWL